MNNSPKQLSFFDNSIDAATDNRPLPLIVAERWGFPLQYQASNGRAYYSIQDWLRGLTQSTNTTRLWNDIKGRNELYGSTVQLQYQASNGRTYQMDFADDVTLYQITQDLREMKSRKALKKAVTEIRDFLAISGAFADQARRDPQAAIEQIESWAGYKRKAEIGKLDRAGYGDRPEVEHLRIRDHNITVFNSLKKSIARVCENPQWGRLINAEYEDLFGEVTSALRVLLETDNIRDALPTLQLSMLTSAEYGLKLILDNRGEMSNDDIRQAIELTFVPIGKSLREICAYAGVHPITNTKLLMERVQ